MRFFDLFLRRSGVERAHVLSRRRTTSRFTAVYPREALGDVRKQICLDFSAAGLNVAQSQVNQGSDAQQASACITVNCPPKLRAEFISQTKRLSSNPVVSHVHFEDVRPAT